MGWSLNSFCVSLPLHKKCGIQSWHLVMVSFAEKSCTIPSKRFRWWGHNISDAIVKIKLRMRSKPGEIYRTGHNELDKRSNLGGGGGGKGVCLVGCRAAVNNAGIESTIDNWQQTHLNTNCKSDQCVIWYWFNIIYTNRFSEDQNWLYYCTFKGQEICLGAHHWLVHGHDGPVAP